MPSLLGNHYGCPNGASLFGPDSDPKTSDRVSVTELPTTMVQTQSTMWHPVKHITAMWLMLCVQHTMKIMMVMVMVGQHHWPALSAPLASSTGHHHWSAPLAGNIGQDPWQHVTNTSVMTMLMTLMMMIMATMTIMIMMLIMHLIMMMMMMMLMGMIVVGMCVCLCVLCV